MARATATWTNTDDTDWEPGDLVRETNWLEQVLQNTEHIAQTHAHDADTANDGGRLRVREGKDIMMLLGAAG
jgi:hypothetical protein